MENIRNWLGENFYTERLLYILGVIVLSAVIYFITKKIIISSINKITSKTKTDLDNILLSDKLLRQLSLAAPLLVIDYFSGQFGPMEALVSRFAGALIAVFILFALNTLLTSVTELLERSRKFGDKPVKGYIQVVKIILFVFGSVIVIGLLADESPFTLLSALGALTAVLILVFKDTILGFVASIQISSYDIVKKGDWIEVPKYGADGDVVDIALHTIKIQNFDKTITVIPTYKLIEESFRNWRGMQQSGGRRIKRAIFIDKTSVRFLTDEEIQDYKNIQLISEYLKNKDKEVANQNLRPDVDSSFKTNKRRLTNLGTFREYIKSYLNSREDIHKGMTFLIRQLPPGPTGVAIEIYVFTSTTDWIEYEGIQADIFDHLLAVVPEFGLRVFQNPTGNDFQKIISEGN